MGLSLNKLFDPLFKVKQHKILMLGLDEAGKTTILFKLKLGKIITYLPTTLGVNIETFEYKRLKISIWDVSGLQNIRIIWNHYYEGSSALIYVIDSADKERIQEAKEEFNFILASESFLNAKILIYANKQDIGVMSVSEIANELGLYDIKQEWHIQGTCTLSGEGLYEGLDWLIKALKSLK